VSERAGLILFTGSIKGKEAGEYSVLEMIAREMGASGFVALTRPIKVPSRFANEIVTHLSHNMPLDVAICMEARNVDAGPAVMFLDPEFAERAKLSEVAHALARSLEAAGSTPINITPLMLAMGVKLYNIVGPGTDARMPARDVGEVLKRNIPEFSFSGESHEATLLAAAKPAMETDLKAANEKQHDRRFVQARLLNIETDIGGREARALVVGDLHRVFVRIGPHDRAWLNPKDRIPFPDELLPVDEEEHQLTVVLSEPDHLPEPLVENVVMGRVGPSSAAKFEFVPRDANTPFRARIVVTHRNRVLQTAVLSARVLAVGESPRLEDEVTVEIEAIVRPQLQDLAQRSRFNATLLLNHTPKGQPTVFCLADNHAELRGMSVIADKINAISARLSMVAAAAKRYAKGLEETESVDLLRFLADKGRGLYEYLITDQADPVLGERLRNDAPVQIVSLVPDAYFPAEFIYEFDIPAPDAHVCPNALEVLKSGNYAKKCSAADHKMDSVQGSSYVCPFGFWGLRRVIERHVWHAVKGAAGADYVLQAEPSSTRPVLVLTSEIILAASANVEKEQAGAVQVLINKLQEIVKAPIELAVSWQKWHDLVQKPGPAKSILLALPHVESRSAFGATEYDVEIGGQIRKTLAIGQEDVLQTEEAPPPLVILFGCDTAVPQSAIDSVVGQFRRKGAGIVVGTVSSMLGSHACVVAEEFTAQIVTLAAGGGVPFGDLLLALRRRALGHGLVMAMCVAGFGDADWLVRTQKVQ
jgi:hypothetical protein